MSSTPIEVYKYMYNAGICTQQAGLYDAWAWFLESQGSCYEVANSVYSKVGIKTKKVVIIKTKSIQSLIDKPFTNILLLLYYIIILFQW